MNVPELLKLFPPPNYSAANGADGGSLTTIRGPCPFEPFLSMPTNIKGANLAFVGVLLRVRNDPRWGPVYQGDLSSYGGDRSSADLALCGEFARLGLRAGEIDTAIRTSGLYRDKWERDDYRDRTIAKALVRQGGAPIADISRGIDLEAGRITIDMSNPPPREWIIEGLLSPGKAAVLAGFGGVSKSQLGLQLAVDIATASAFVTRNVKSGSVLLFLGEEDVSEIARRTNAIARYRHFDAQKIALVQDRVRALPLVGVETRLTVPEKGHLVETEIAKKIIDAAKGMEEPRLIVLDHMGLFHGGDFNAREDAALTMRIVNRIAVETGAAVLVLAHTQKSAHTAEQSDASMVAGSTAFVDHARGAWVLSTMRQNEARTFNVSEDDRHSYVSLTIVKANLGPQGEVHWFRRVPFDSIALLEPVTLNAAAVATKQKASLQATIISIVRSHAGQFSKTSFREAQSGTRGPLGASKRDVGAAIEDLLARGDLFLRAPTDAERQTYGHGPQVRSVLDLPPAARSPVGGSDSSGDSK